MRRSVVLMVLLSLLLAFGGTTSAQALAVPSSMASIGDSMTRAADVCCWYGDHPANSWSTGGASWDGITSHYERLRALNPAIAGHNYNDAESGARMSDAPSQSQRAVAQQVRYVTILMGANDACTSSPTSMTPVDVYRSQFRQTLQILDAGLPGSAHIFVASVPDVYRLWQIYHTDLLATLVWQTAGICQSLLAPNRTEAERQAVRGRVIAFNTVLAQECAAITKCRYDAGAVFNYQFTRSDVSKLDYFHPSLTGQAALARTTWPHSWWG
ncbi:lysophospholipase L1-like esterase [Kribbella sp. VKM Ac-2569]|uniref:SGNH/GDSL hydrolase family protein n=1 Tax=Kribbella sp. VKM Ac-2569 TaxID=2512220 RepID=UPI0010E958BC|nr:SGNH/GDSL hydrolase family protein [Kribbella sp. VKM Ac-2569]RZT26443.1 lysophospholipase L1-like esterase [Kribbella sp. VKM Ac-2569]